MNQSIKYPFFDTIVVQAHNFEISHPLHIIPHDILFLNKVFWGKCVLNKIEL